MYTVCFSLCFNMVKYDQFLIVSFKATLLALRHPYDWHNASEVTLKNIDKLLTQIQ